MDQDEAFMVEVLAEQWYFNAGGWSESTVFEKTYSDGSKGIVSRELGMDLTAWIRANCSGEWTYSYDPNFESFRFWFELEEDAVGFTVRIQ